MSSGDNAGVLPRKRKSKRRSSILKFQSPSRTALGDLDPNAALEKAKLGARNKRRSSKRVSFADTYQVQEFWTEHHAKELGLWENDSNRGHGEGGKSSTPKSQEDSNEDAQVAVTISEPSRSGDNNDATEQQGLKIGDVSEGPGHKITGLETLLTGQIRKSDIEDEVFDTKVEEGVNPGMVSQEQPHQQQQLSSYQGNSTDGRTTSAPQASQSMPSTSVDENNPAEPLDEVQPAQSETDEAHRIVISKKHSRRSLTLTGAPNYLMRLPSNDSSLAPSMSHDDSAAHHDWDNSHHGESSQEFGYGESGAGDMDLTGCQRSFPEGSNISAYAAPQGDQNEGYTDNRSFFQMFMENSKSSGGSPFSENEGVHPQSDAALNEEPSPVEKTDNQSFFQSFMQTKSDNSGIDVLSGVSATAESPPGKLDSKTFLASLMGGKSAQVEPRPLSPADVNDKTRLFREDETIGGMELTTCIGGIQPNISLSSSNLTSSSTRRPLEERPPVVNPDVTVRFGERGDDVGNMEMTGCYDGKIQSVHQSQKSNPTKQAENQENATHMLDQSGAMDFTTGIGSVTDGDFMRRMYAAKNTTRFSNMTGMTFMNGTYSNVTLNNTSAILRDLDSAMGLKRKSDAAADESLPVAQSRKLRRSEGPHESTRVFPAEFAPRLAGIQEDNGNKFEPTLSPIKNEAGDHAQVICGDETAAIEITECIKSTGVLKQVDVTGHPEVKGHPEVNGGDRTKMFSAADDSGDMEMTECHAAVVVSGEVLLQKSQSGQSTTAPPTAMESTKIFRANETCGMELTTCVDNAISQNNTTAGKCTESTTSVDLEKTKVFRSDETGGMEFTTCVGDILQHSQSAVKQPDTKISVKSTVDHTKIYQSDETCGLEFTTCVGTIIESNTSTAGGNAAEKQQLEQERTQVFGHDDTAKMEMTACIGQIEGTNEKRSSVPGENAAADRTKVFSNDGQMEMTECVGFISATSQSRTETMNVAGNTLVKTQQEGNRSKVFSENTARMDMTECIGGVLATATKPTHPESIPSASLRCENQNERTTIFSGDAGGMEMTECNSVVIPAQNKSLYNTIMMNRTKNTLEATAKMDMTECVGGLYPEFDCKSAKQNEKDIESTRIFSAESENTAKMDMTECVGGVLPSMTPVGKVASNPGLSGLKARLANLQTDGERTMVFSENTAKMDMTECVGGVLPSMTTAGKVALHPSLSVLKARLPNLHTDGEQTMVFSENTAKMDMTECVGGMLPSMTPARNVAGKVALNPGLSDLKDRLSNLQKDGERTMVFSENTAKMDMTECVGGVFPSFAPTPAATVSGSSNSEIKTDNMRENPDCTKVFRENTAKMDMTECIGNIFPRFAHNSPTEKSSDCTVSERTKVFSEETCNMEMTECVGSVFPSCAPNLSTHATKSKSLASANKSGLDHTKMFGDETGHMEMTECNGQVFPSIAHNVSRAEDKENIGLVSQNLQQGHSRLLPGTDTKCEESAAADHTKVFSDNDGGMDMTECVSLRDVVSKEVPEGMNIVGDADKVFPSEHTARMDMTECVSLSDVVSKEVPECANIEGEAPKIFSSEHTARMDMTECVSLSDVVSKEEPECANIPGNATKIFSSEHTASMEMTECISGNTVSDASVHDSIARNASSLVKNQDNMTGGEHTRMFSENTAKMDMTECVGGMLSVLTPADGQDVSAYKRKKLEDVSQKTAASEEGKEDTVQDEEEKRRSETFTFDGSKTINSQDESKRSSDTFTIGTISDNLKDAGKMDAEDGELRRSDTFTLNNKSARETGIVSEVSSKSSTTQVDSADAKKTLSADDRQSSTESYTGVGIMEEATLVMDSTEEFVLPGFSDMYKKGFKEPDVTCELSMEMSALQASNFGSQLSASTLSFSSSTSASRRSRLLLSQGSQGGSQEETSVLATSVVENTKLPTTGPVPMEDFIEFLRIGDTLPKGRRSMFEPISVAPPKVLGDFLELSLITHPKYQMYEWANAYLGSSVEKMRESIKEQETRMSTDNPAIIKELQKLEHTSPEEAELLRKQVISLHEACKKSGKYKFRQWRKKMASSTLDALKQSHEELETSVSIISTSNEKMEESFRRLEQYDAELDAAIRQLESTKLPTEEDQLRYLDDKEKLGQINQEVEQLKDSIDSLEKQKCGLKSDTEAMQVTYKEIELEWQHLASETKLPDFDKQQAMEAINGIHELQEWTLEEYKTEGGRAHFTFLEGSLSLVFNLGNKIGGEESAGREITSVSFESLLADDACVAAKVANIMGLGAVDAASIKRQTPTTKSLPQVLQHLSSRLCPARLIYDEVAHIAFWHQVSCSDQVKFTVEFSNLAAFLKFYVTFELTPGAYPMKAIPYTYTHNIGHNVESEIREALSSVKPGWGYLSRLVTSIEDVIQSRIPKEQDY